MNLAHREPRCSPFRRLIDSVVLSNLLIILAGLLALLITSRHFGVEARGVYVTWSSWASVIGTLSLLGTEAFVVVAAHDRGAVVSLWQTRWVLAGGMLIAGFVAIVILSLIDGRARVLVGGVLIAISGPLTALHSHVQQANREHGWRFNISRSLGPTCGLFMVLVGVFALDATPDFLFLLFGVGVFSGAAGAAVVAAQPAAPSSGFTAHWLLLARIGAPLTLLTWALINTDTVIVSIPGNDADVALYGIGAAARGVVGAIGTAVGLRWYATRKSLGGVRGAILQFTPAALTALAIVIAAPIAVPLLLGADFAAGVPVIQILAVAGILTSVDFLVGRVVLLRVGYRWPIVMRASALTVLAAAFCFVGGDPTKCALIYALVIGITIGGQLALLGRMRRSPPTAVPRADRSEFQTSSGGTA